MEPRPVITIISYVVPSFNFEDAVKQFKNELEKHTVLFQILEKLTAKKKTGLFEILKTAFGTVCTAPKWSFILPYMNRHISNTSSGYRGNGLYNYVLGYQEEKLVLRVGKYENNFDRGQTTKRSSGPQTVIGIKHMQLACTQFKVMFSGVLDLYDKDNITYARVSPMSGTWKSIMDEIIDEIKNTDVDDTSLQNALNIMNIICTSYAIHLLSENPDKNLANNEECPVILCKYPKKEEKKDEIKILNIKYDIFPRGIKLDLTCLNNPNLDICSQDIPRLILLNPKPK